MQLWDAATYERLRTLEEASTEVKVVTFSPDSKRLATASFEPAIRIWALERDGVGHEAPAAPHGRPRAGRQPPERAAPRLE